LYAESSSGASEVAVVKGVGGVPTEDGRKSWNRCSRRSWSWRIGRISGELVVRQWPQLLVGLLGTVMSVEN